MKTRPKPVNMYQLRNAGRHKILSKNNICLLINKLTIVCFLLILLVFFLCLGNGISYAGLDQWVTDGPSDLIINALVASPQFASDKTIYAATDDGIYKSTDAGISWSRLCCQDEWISALAISPNFSTDKTFFAVKNSSLYKSTNGGSTWSIIAYPDSGTIKSVAIHPNYANTKTIYIGTSGGIYKSINDGTNWTFLDLLPVSSRNIDALTISDNNLIFAATHNGYFYRIDEANAEIKSLGANGGLIKAIATIPNYSIDYKHKTLFIARNTNSVIRYQYDQNDNASLDQINEGLGVSICVTALCVSPNFDTDHLLFAGTWGSGVFRCNTEQDGTSPSIIKTDPLNEATGVSKDKIISITFDEKIQKGNTFGNITLKNTSDNKIVTCSSTIDSSGRTLLIDPSADLLYGKTYKLVIPSEAIVDNSNNFFPQDYLLLFTITNEPDKTAPTVSSTDPAADSTNIAINKTITITFSENVQASTAYDNIAITGPSSSKITFSKSINASTLTLDPETDFSYGSTYKVTIPINAVKDSSGNALATQYVFGFTTQKDTTAPTVSSTTPTANSNTLSKESTITVTFSENIQAGSTYEKIVLNDSSDQPIKLTKTIKEKVLTIDPAIALTPGATYTLILPASCVKDAAGNMFASEYKLTFTVAQTIGAPQELKLISSSEYIELSWTPVSDQDLAGYNVYRRLKDKNSNATKLNASPITQTKYQDKTVEAGKTYIYFVTAINKSKQESAKSNEIEASLGKEIKTSGFNDVKSDKWYSGYIKTLSDKKIISGYPGGKFKPEAPITRAEFSKIICLAMGWSLETPSKETFKDVSKSDWAFGYIETAKAKNVIDGYKNGTFKPNESISRAEIAKIIAQALKLQSEASGESNFKDIKKSWAADYINACYKAGIIAGYKGNSFKPTKNATRAEVAKIIALAIDKK